MKLLLYCTKAKPMLRVAREDLFKHQDRARCYRQEDIKYFTQYVSEDMYEANGKIVAECDFEVEKIQNKLTNNNSHLELFTNNLIEKELFEKSCLNRYEMFSYLKNNFTKKDEIKGYAIHIKNLHIFDEPRELSEYMVYDKSYDNMFGWAFEEAEKYKPLTKAPQNMMYVERDDIRYVYIKYVLISIKPEWLCKILNGEKTIEVRKKVLKEMIK